MAKDAITLLKDDHQTVEALFARYEGATDAEGRRLVVEEIIRELSIHAAIEEQLLYPAVEQELPDGERLAEEARREHQEVKETLAELQRMDPDDGGLDARMRSLIADVRHHVEEEEGEMLPRFRKAIPADRLRQIGEAMEGAKLIAPTRPHPNAPDTQPGVMVAGMAAAVVDRTRDAARDVGRRALRRPRSAEEVTGPGRKPASKRAGAKKSTAKKSTAKKSAAKRSTAKKSTAKKSTAKKSTAKRSAGKKSTAKKSSAKRSTAKKSTAKKSTAKRSAGKKSTAKKSTAKRSAGKKSTAKKSSAKKSSAKRSSGRGRSS